MFGLIQICYSHVQKEKKWISIKLKLSGSRICFSNDQNVRNMFKLLISIINGHRKKLQLSGNSHEQIYSVVIQNITKFNQLAKHSKKRRNIFKLLFKQKEKTRGDEVLIIYTPKCWHVQVLLLNTEDMMP